MPQRLQRDLRHKNGSSETGGLIDDMKDGLVVDVKYAGIQSMIKVGGVAQRKLETARFLRKRLSRVARPLNAFEHSSSIGVYIEHLRPLQEVEELVGIWMYETTT